MRFAAIPMVGPLRTLFAGGATVEYVQQRRDHISATARAARLFIRDREYLYFSGKLSTRADRLLTVVSPSQ